MSAIVEEVEKERMRNLRDIIRHAQWEAEMVKKLGSKWFEQRDEWLIKAWEADKEMWKNPEIKQALIRTILAKDKLKQRKIIR